jgi:hypothetical protein
MKTKHRFLSLVGSLVCFAGGAAYADEQSIPEDLLENLPSITSPAPSIQGRNSPAQFAMEFVPPSPGVDYKILRITPDPTIGYDIMITGPRPELAPVEIDTGKEELPLENK